MTKAVFLATTLLLMIVSNANADLVINISGEAGTGFTTWTFSTAVDAQTSASGTVRDNTGNTWTLEDTTQFGGGDGIADASIQDQVFTLTGDATFSYETGDLFGNIVTETEDITGIFLDDDGVGAGDDLGIRLANTIVYGNNRTVSWSGSGTVNVDVNQLVAGTFQMDFGNQWTLDQGNTVVTIVAIPEPSSFGFFLVGAAGLVFVRRRT